MFPDFYFKQQSLNEGMHKSRDSFQWQECLGTINNICESQQLFSKRVVLFFVSNWITNYCIFLTIVLKFYLRFSLSEKQTWWIEIKDNLLQCLLSCVERSSVIVIYSSCQEKSITDDIKMTYFAWATYCLNVHNLIERDYFLKYAL